MGYILVILAGTIMGVILLLAFRVWFVFLINLSQKYDIPKRRKIAARVYILVVPIVGSIMLIDFFAITSVKNININFSAPIYILSLLPAIIWWVRKLDLLRTLGYGRNNAK